jgi:hypothetical protein
MVSPPSWQQCIKKAVKAISCFHSFRVKALSHISQPVPVGQAEEKDGAIGNNGKRNPGLEEIL